MSRTPAAELARVKVAYPLWSVTREGSGFAAVRADTRERVTDPTLAGLETALSVREDRKRSQARSWAARRQAHRS